MEKTRSLMNRAVNRRSLLKNGVLAGGAVAIGAGVIGGTTSAFGWDSGSSLTKGDAAILRFLAAAELIESDLWTQYAELGGIGNNPPIEVDPNQTLNNYQVALSNLDSDGPQYITSNTLDEVSHAAFLNAYLASKGSRAGQLRRVPHFGREHSYRIIGHQAPHEPHASQRRHQLVRSLPQYNQSQTWVQPSLRRSL